MARVILWLDRLSDDRLRRSIGNRLETAATESFTVLRWGLLVGLARLIALETGL